ncbi:hypothetical protein Vadar_000187 [Vaccinium darrowii]|uniref:Uncharacterized protein n=1 Tax=Vaccinium darrowii TaxID=229202 RepID=A0ACB7XM21_9ERIC|nr:hypothetical protein Vadar_000187 [Vaccinium darrowii]
MRSRRGGVKPFVAGTAPTSSEFSGTFEVLVQLTGIVWLGMRNQELLGYFSSYAAVMARHAYGPQGHRGMRGCLDHRPVHFYPGGKRQLYGYMAEKQDLDLFNKHCEAKATRLKFETRSYQEMVVNQMRQMSEDNQQLIWFKDKVANEQRRSKALAESFEVVSEKLRKTVEENRIVWQRSKMHHEQNKEEMDFQEQFFKDQLQVIHKAREDSARAGEEGFGSARIIYWSHSICCNTVLLVELFPFVRASLALTFFYIREEDFAKFVKSQDKEMVEFVSER